LKKSFVPKREGRELKELTRYRSSIVEERAREYNRLDKVLQGANIKLSSVASTIDTKSGLAMRRTLSEEEERQNTQRQFHIKKTVIQCGKSAGRSKNIYLNSMYRRIAARRGANRAAVGHAILKICYYMIRDRSHYHELGADYFNNLNNVNPQEFKGISTWSANSQGFQNTTLSL
jgi:hypothetical protein